MTNTEKNEVEDAIKAFKKLTVLRNYHLGDNNYQEYLDTLIKSARNADKMREALGFYVEDWDFGKKARDVLKSIGYEA